MKKIILHIGLEKTGTTSLQYFFKHNRENFNKRGVLYPDIGYRENALAHFILPATLCHLDGFPADFVPHTNFNTESIWNNLRDVIIGTDCEYIVLSAEHFSSRVSLNGMKYIKQFFDNLPVQHDLNIVVYLREHCSFLKSSYSTYAKTGGELMPSEYFEKVLNKDYLYNFRFILDSWANAFGKDSLVVFNYTDVIKDNLSVVDHFCNYYNINTDGFNSPAIRFNKSLSYVDCIVKIALNRAGIKNAVNNNELQKLSDELSKSFLLNDSLLLNDNSLKCLKSVYNNDYIYISNNYLDGFKLNTKI